MMRILLSLLLFTMNSVMYAQKSAQAYYELAEQKSVKDKLKQAYNYYYKAAEIDHNYLYYVKAAEAYWGSHNTSKSKHLQETMRLYNKSFTTQPWNKEGLISRAGFWEREAKYINAINDLDSLLVRHPDNTEGYLLKARIYMSKKDTARAFNVYDKALLNIPKEQQVKVYHDKGFYCYSKGFWKASVDSYLKAIDLSDKLTFRSYCQLSSSYFNLGEKERACYYFDLCEINKWPALKSKEALLLNCKGN